jgi:DNA-binding response OmpR family regulator
MPEYKIMVVDDEMEIVRAVGMRLMVAGYKVITALDGGMAIGMAEIERPDLVILDIGMPHADGHKVAACLRENPRTWLTPIIYLTARTSEEDKARAYQSGAVAYLTKPFKTQDLLGVVSRALIPHATC